ncbi:MAG: chemotaxis-specific protein-glutamate methyltransferase CheB [Candidatus Binatus sp.]|uniref:chemotaxis-specific protein-glutamate methyltransferase CheB n=1 Tax=Candidatus Binatus sp. TaxID=2811406 RepID=UPI003BAF0B95
MAAIRVLVADDSMTVRKRLVQALSTDAGIQVIAEAADGRTATELCRRIRPDVVTMDVMMPVMDGVTATEYIMANCPTPILMVSASSNRGQVLQTFDALAAGAVDVLDKPAADTPDGVWERELVGAVMVSRIKAIRRPSVNRRSRVVGAAAGVAAPVVLPLLESDEAVIVAIGASIGGPSAIAKILSQIPAGFPLPILLVIHIAPEFAQSLVEWIATRSNKLPVRVAVDGEPIPRPGLAEILMAPPDRHLVVRGGRLRVTDTPPRHLCRPSIDELFESVARECGSQAIACLLTGMGKDGAAGLLAVRQKGGHTIAQDEASSTVFGMPREAIALDAAQIVAPLADVAGTLCLMARRRNGDAL